MNFLSLQECFIHKFQIEFTSSTSSDEMEWWYTGIYMHGGGGVGVLAVEPIWQMCNAQPCRGVTD